MAKDINYSRIHAAKHAKNRAVLMLLIALCVIFYGLAIVRTAFGS